MLLDCVPISPRPFLAAESPIWDDRGERAFFVDIKGQALFCWVPRTNVLQEWPMNEDIGFVALTEGPDLIVGLKSGLALFDPEKPALRPFTSFRPATDERLNDGKVDANGNLFFGTMEDGAAPKRGILYRLSSDRKLTTIATGYGVPNGPAFANEGAFYHCATDSGRIDRHTPTEEGWIVETLHEMPAGAGLPDGISLDDDGQLWCGLWGGSGMLVIDPITKAQKTVSVPATYVTSMTPICTDGKTLLITSAASPVLRGERGGAPFEGRVFQAKLTRPWVPQSPRFNIQAS